MTAARERSPSDASAERAGVGALARWWLPTAFGSSLLAWEIPLVVAIVGRMSGGPSAMAALGVGLSVLVVINSPALALAPLVVAELRRHGSARLLRHAASTGLLGCAVLAGVAALPGVSTMFPAALGLPPALRADLRVCLLSFATAPLAVALRRYLHGRLIASGNARPIAAATLVRIAVTVLAALGLRALGVPSAWVGGLALSCGAWAETAALTVPARPLGPVPPPVAPAGRVVRQHARIASSVLLNMVPALVTTVVIARSHQAADSLVVWPALYGLVSLGTVPQSDLDSVGAAFLRRAGRPAVLLRFTLLLGGVLLVGAELVALTPLARLYLTDFSDVPAGPAALGVAWAGMLMLAPALWSVRGRLRATAIAGTDSRALPRAAAVHLTALLGCGGLLPFTALPGIACAVLALIGALVAEILGLRAMTAAGPRPSVPRARGATDAD